MMCSDTKILISYPLSPHYYSYESPFLSSLTSLLRLFPFFQILLLYLRMSNELLTTDTEENAMAAPAIMGLRRNPVTG